MIGILMKNKLVSMWEEAVVDNLRYYYICLSPGVKRGRGETLITHPI
jgi:hypothetical protein